MAQPSCSAWRAALDIPLTVDGVEAAHGVPQRHEAARRPAQLLEVAPLVGWESMGHHSAAWSLSTRAVISPAMLAPTTTALPFFDAMGTMLFLSVLGLVLELVRWPPRPVLEPLRQPCGVQSATITSPIIEGWMAQKYG